MFPIKAKAVENLISSGIGDHKFGPIHLILNLWRILNQLHVV